MHRRLLDYLTVKGGSHPIDIFEVIWKTSLNIRYSNLLGVSSFNVLDARFELDDVPFDSKSVKYA